MNMNTDFTIDRQAEMHTDTRESRRADTKTHIHTQAHRQMHTWCQRGVSAGQPILKNRIGAPTLTYPKKQDR